jgi:hypothetical protein
MGIKEHGYCTFKVSIDIKVTLNDMIKFKLKQLMLKRYKYKLQNREELN